MNRENEGRENNAITQKVNASAVDRLIMWHRANLRKKAIDNIRGHMAFFGHNLDDMTDAEIEEGVVRFGKVVASSGFTVQQAADSFISLNKINANIT